MADSTDKAAASETTTFSDSDLAKARECFKKAQELAAANNFDYAIEWYINGLEYWPEAVDEGHKPCRAASLFRGKKKVSFGDSMKYKTGGKDAKRAMLNAEMLLSKEPQNIGYMETMFKAADKAELPLTTMWIGEIYEDAAVREPKANPARFTLLRDIYERLADRAAETDIALAISAMERVVTALSKLRNLKSTDGAIANDLRDMAGKLTILKGKYNSAETFRDSMRDDAQQRDQHDKERLVQADERLDELIASALKQHQANTKDVRALTDVVDLLCRRERESDENQAVSLLVKAYKELGDYRLKSRAFDLRMRQNRRKLRQAQEKGDAEAIRAQEIENLKFELQAYKDRVKHYPTELRWKYEYGQRLFKLGHYDEAIPVLQEARADPKTRHQCSLYVGRCFFAKGYFAQAIDTFREAISTKEIAEDELGKKLNYWLGRAYESDGKHDDALKIYGQLIQWDYNYRKGEVRKRIDDLRNAGGSGSA